jgi:hypothetical protein
MKRFRLKLNTPVGRFSRRWIKRALISLRKMPDLESRVQLVSGWFLRRPYEENPLDGGPASLELFFIFFDRFDCVTYVETVLALSRARTTARFFFELRHLRYKGGRVDWFTRNHFMTEWLRRNEERGAIADLTRGRDMIKKTRTLKGVAGLQPEESTFRFFPKRSFARVRPKIRTGDVMMFVSTKKHLDVFHMGILIRKGDQILMRHATRSAGKVVEQDVNEFLEANRMTGFILARPLCDL